MLRFFMWLTQKVFTGQGARHPKKQVRKYEAQINYLVSLLGEDLNSEVSYSYEQRNSVIVFRTKKEIIARVTFHPKGVLRRNTYIRVRTNKVALVAWFQLAFLEMRVVVAPLSETLLLTYQKPHEQ